VTSTTGPGCCPNEGSADTVAKPVLSPAANGWGNPGNPGSAQGVKYNRDNIVRITVVSRSGERIKVRVHRLTAPLWWAFLDDIDRMGYTLTHKKGIWGYCHRWIRGRDGVLSWHSFGTAVDIHSALNPMIKRRLGESDFSKRLTDMPPWMVERAEKTYGFRWGGRYRTRSDAMHTEVIESPNEVRARCERLGLPPYSPDLYDNDDVTDIDEIRGKAHDAAQPKPVPPQPERRLLFLKKPHMYGDDVVLLNTKLGLDGALFDEETFKAVKDFQGANRLAADGVVGPKTWAAILGKKAE
ncbi:MAG: M15 family metallopeptidase, partial [Cetobacterium sp.]